MLVGQIEAFLTIARLGNMTRAADELHLSQPSLTGRLRSLEQELGDQLFVRSSKGMRLTDAGRAFRPYAERAVAALDDGRKHLVEQRESTGGRLTLGAPPGVSTYALPLMLEQFTTAYPSVSISVHTGHSEQILSMVVREEVQLGLSRALHHADVESIPLYEDELVLVVHPQHRLVGLPPAPLLEISRERLIMFDPASSYYDLTRALFRTGRVTALRAMELDNIEAVKRMVERRLGVAFLPHTAVVRDVADGRMCIVRLEDCPPMYQSIVALRRRDSPPIHTVNTFLDLAQTAADGIRTAE